MATTYQLTHNGKSLGWTFEVEDDATEKEIAEAAHELYIQNVADFGWERVDEGEGQCDGDT